MKAEWFIYHTRLSKELCETIVEQATKLVRAEPGLVGLDGHINQNYRGCTCRWLHEDFVDPEDGGLTWKDLFGHLKRCMDIANLDRFGVDCIGMRHVQFTTYKASSDKTEGDARPERDDHFDMHKDTYFVEPRYASHRKLSITVQLSDPAAYDGGDFEFYPELKQPGKELLRPQGTILIFPAFYYHRVTPVTRGTRHVLVSWYEGPKWR